MDCDTSTFRVMHYFVTLQTNSAGVRSCPTQILTKLSRNPRFLAVSSGVPRLLRSRTCQGRRALRYRA